MTTHKITSTQTLKSYKEHLLQAAIERFAYKKICDMTNNLFKEHRDCSLSPPAYSGAISAQVQSSSVVAETHYSFDFAQQVHILSNLLPMYFLTPRKCAFFGICCEAIPCQVRLKGHVHVCIIHLFPLNP